MKVSCLIILFFISLNGFSQNTNIKKVLYAGMVSESPGVRGKSELRTIDAAFSRSSLFENSILPYQLEGYQENRLWDYDFFVQGRVVGTIGEDIVELSVYELFPETRSRRLIDCSQEYKYVVSPTSNVQWWIENVLRDILYLKNEGQMRNYVYMTHTVAPSKQSLKQSLELLPKRLNKDPAVMSVAFFLVGEKKDEHSFVKSVMKPDMTKLFVSAKKGESGRTEKYPVTCAADEDEVCDKVYDIILNYFKK